ncbi:MAG: hypothetical protein UU48_C0017G0008 [Candidatus Uhrbacteria bacterium GW2011_GWF2_41_16]|uniref:DUF86 domain-containing protein n=1 Tax=Candidatus Uhrbacteria bacterium GW2011_GWF2_41_16 TaxID=1618997 RepID=A0A0G0YAP3_9BACT|nr:MAG: hypothetical protein UU48_C0017G0008 [Candidatus Uhrbacteria bacterium GW2011_GWF2_41_16]OHB36125.1 MAG: hypothetical protein A2Y09_10825 [Planctomycetes bacterium GWA2_39_15]
MSKDRQILDYLNDIMDSIADIKEFVIGMSYENFTEDKKTIKAVIRSLEVIGEAANKIPLDVRESYPEIQWQEIIDMRNKLIHEYSGIDNDIVWQTIEDDLNPLEETVRKILHDLYCK